ncbi:inhibitor of vertebrate lysozyme family protein [Pseudomonas massiliensis]|uniref:inhibitor of vertebrate lysozyme family protein n=1 Tax=Pseudomonas massiliensis TaxID=522492 RepID=UPI0006942DB3|nr:inhibitor of vertebrate lysozyme family protein [Pseudomonas massiliensis]
MKGWLRGIALVATVAATNAWADNDGQERASNLIATDTQYRHAWQEAVRKEERLPDWVLNLSGASSPMTAVTEDGEKYLVGPVCERADDCLHNRVLVAFSWNKAKAYALWVKVPTALPEDKTPSRHADYRWLGSPDEGIQAMLTEQLKSEPGWY